MVMGRSGKGGEVESKRRPTPRKWALTSPLTMAFKKNKLFKEILQH